jgi:D-alanyl-D-alanine carboxypeptidase (penicillin-binding protein 5/6)
MNTLARHLGMRHTHFLNPGGAYITKNRQQPYSTAVDIARLTHYAYQKAQFRFYASQASRTIQIIRRGLVRSFYLQNTNQFLGYKHIDGVKANCRGEINRSHLVLTADYLPIATQHENRWIIITPRRLLIVLLESTNCLNDGLASLRYGWRLYDEWITRGRPIKEHDFL